MKRLCFLIFISFLFSFSAFAGGGWPQPKGHGFFKFSQWWLISDQHFTDTGLLDPNVTQGIFTTSIYAEYGFTDRLTGILYFPLFSRTYFNNTVSATTGEILTAGEAINGVADTDISLKYGLIVNKPVVLSATLTLGLPFGESQGGTAGNLQLGDGEFNQMLQLDAGTSFQLGKVAAYANAYAGFNNRTNGFSDELRYGIEAGTGFFGSKLYTIFRLYGISSLKNGSNRNNENSTSIFANNTEFLTFSPEIAYNINEKWGVSATYASALKGRLIFAAPSYAVGVYLNL
ncbi:MAG: hypothetical protein MK226_00230 [Saprospiraceae bacterium]|jgi:hypothetical protein|nr:hypothetical protein [Saprospiraceae bacterium]